MSKIFHLMNFTCCLAVAFYRRLMVLIHFLLLSQARYACRSRLIQKSEKRLYGDLMVHATWEYKRAQGGVAVLIKHLHLFTFEDWFDGIWLKGSFQEETIGAVEQMSEPNVATKTEFSPSTSLHWNIHHETISAVFSFWIRFSEKIATKFYVLNFSSVRYLCFKFKIVSDIISRFKTLLNSIVLLNLLLVSKWQKV